MSTPAPAGFTIKPVRNRTAGGLTGARTLGLILHVQAGNNALSGWFDNPAAQASSTWWAGKGGGREQYGNPDTDKFWAQAAGNSLYHSIETEGYPGEALTAAQVESCAVAYAFGHARYGWPFQLAEKPGDAGLGWHGMGGSAWGGHTGCPGDLRKAQRAAILARARQIANPAPTPKEDDMPSVDDVWNHEEPNPVTGQKSQVGDMLRTAMKDAYYARQLAGQTLGIVKALAAKPQGLTAAEVAAAAKAGATDALDDKIAGATTVLNVKGA